MIDANGKTRNNFLRLAALILLVNFLRISNFREMAQWNLSKSGSKDFTPMGQVVE